MMKVVLKPSVTFETEGEKHNFLECLNTIRAACNDMVDCGECPWHWFCQKHLEEGLSDFISDFKKMLDEYEDEGKENEDDFC